MYSAIVASFALLAVPGLAAPNVLERAACTTNACLQAVKTNTKVAGPDCTSFLATTVTPCSKTVKTTITLTSTTGCPFSAPSVVTTSTAQAPCPASVTPSVIPDYASGACTDNAAYASACGCINARAVKTTLPAGTVTSTIYKTVKAAPTFAVQQFGGTYRNYWVWTGFSSGEQPQGGYLEVTADRANAEYFTISGKTLLGGNGTQAWGSQASGCHGCYEPTYEAPVAENSSVLACSLGSTLKGDGYLDLTCKGPHGGTVFQNCSPDGDSLDLGGSPERSFYDCFDTKLGAYPICS